IAVVTGANKGIGMETVRQLARKGVKVVLTARDEKRGTEAAAALVNADPSLATKLVFHQLDVCDPQSIAALAEFVEKEFGH
ncbi:hypothetical protein ACLOJK_000138, partial [Asimina triloba]